MKEKVNKEEILWPIAKFLISVFPPSGLSCPSKSPPRPFTPSYTPLTPAKSVSHPLYLVQSLTSLSSLKLLVLFSSLTLWNSQQCLTTSPSLHSASITTLKSGTALALLLLMLPDCQFLLEKVLNRWAAHHILAF